MKRKVWRATTMPTTAKPKSIAVTEQQRKIYQDLRKLFLEHKKGLDVRVDTDNHLELWTLHKYRTESFHPKEKQGILFAGLAIRSTYVGFYFYPMHVKKDFIKGLPDELRSCQKGDSTFHIKSLSDTMVFQLRKLIDDGLTFYKKQGFIR
jgi:hypothetical protein